ncbi:MAG: transcription termination factor Rho [Chloroflexi bacterium]|jgi:transcription termination factor Rho|nr:transcription termination factor Rho [Chloroflexota bacterium]MBT7080694.1 transcription termination factor Rho [Chloroflexota bacterium]MBT7290181.1 transcription termination factor Rho [Chloroflexota bacterium]
MTNAVSMTELNEKPLEELAEIAKGMKIANYGTMKKAELVTNLMQYQAEQQGQLFLGGTLDLVDDGFGFLRRDGLMPGASDVYISQSQIRRFSLRTGDFVSGQARYPKDNEKYYGLLRVEAVNGINPDVAKLRPHFDNFTPTFPDEIIDLITSPKELSQRVINMVAPIGRGQRGLILSPPKAGKTFLLKSIAHGIMENYENIHLMVCLIGERPEEVTDWKRSVDAEVVSSTFDEPVENHTRVAEIAIESAKRRVETGQDVVILLDSITRLTRAYNLATPSSGRTLSGGIDPVALYPPKRFFGSARNTDESGSLTILATCLVDTGSRMDDVIYEEFKGTGNMEVHLDRKLSDKRVFPSIDISRSSTRREELLLSEKTLKQVWLLRKMMSLLSSNANGTAEATERLLERLAKTKTNEEFLNTLSKEAS